MDEVHLAELSKQGRPIAELRHQRPEIFDSQQSIERGRWERIYWNKLDSDRGVVMPSLEQPLRLDGLTSKNPQRGSDDCDPQGRRSGIPHTDGPVIPQPSPCKWKAAVQARSTSSSISATSSQKVTIHRPFDRDRRRRVIDIRRRDLRARLPSDRREALVPSAIDEFNSEGVTDMKLTVRGPRLTLKMSDRFPPLHIAAHHCTQLIAASKRARSTDNSLRHCLTES